MSTSRSVSVPVSILLVLLAAAVLAVPGCSPREPAGLATPEPRLVRLETGATVSLRPVSFEIPAAFRQKYAAAVDSLTARIEGASTGSRDGSAPALPVRVVPGANPSRLDSAARSRLARPEAYRLEIGDDGIRVVSSDSVGALHGLGTLADMAARRGGYLPEGTLVDWPDHRIRAFHFVARGVSLASARRLIRLARENRFNTLIVQLADGVALESMGSLPRGDAWSVDEFRGIVEYARENGLDVIPELKLLTHQSKLLKRRYPGLMYNRHTYDPRKERTYEVVLPIVDEALEVTGADALHIGHDEVRGVGREDGRADLPPAEKPLPAELFLRDVERLHSHLSALGVETWMWGDMLVESDEFPGMLARHLHGVPAYTSLRGRLPEEIVVNLWHYADDQDSFPSTRAMLNAGHSVLGATWRLPETTRAFSRYVDSLGSPDTRGMIATTWWLVQRGYWEAVSEVARVSGEAFWTATGGDGP